MMRCEASTLAALGKSNPRAIRCGTDHERDKELKKWRSHVPKLRKKKQKVMTLLDALDLNIHCVSVVIGITTMQSTA
jgi:hypothetical protein